MSADDVSWWANWILVGALLIGVAATYAIVVSGNIKEANLKRELKEKDDALEKYKLTVEGKVADAKSEGFKAGETAGNALVRAAELEKEAAAARLETEKLKAGVAWRTFSEAQGTELGKVLSGKPGSVNLRWMDGDPEAPFLAIQISQILERAHWKVAPGSLKPANGIMFGFVLPPVAGDDAQTLREAFAAAKLPFSAVSFSQQGASFNVSEIPDAPFLMVGSRMPVVP